MRIFIDVDVQNDFCEPKGALYVSGSPNDLYRAIVRHAGERAIPILGSVDSHVFDAWEFASSGRAGPQGEKPNFPDHCVKGTHGWLKVEGTLPARFRFVPNVPNLDAEWYASEVVDQRASGLYFEKEVYSLFANPNAERVLEAIARRAGAPLDLVVFGVATDYCVRAAALGLRERGYATTVLTNAIRGITEEGSARALDEMRDAGCRLSTWEELCGSSV
ncbi:MAG: isochorismatase family protein [Polyangiaceae bacterium]|nr:isochorismatase family protein [Polyangiaceae bacterium]